MSESQDRSVAGDDPAGPTTGFAGEEAIGERSSPAGDLRAALAIAVLAVLAMVLAAGLDSPGRSHTAPGLLPFLVGLTLLCMVAGLALKAVRRGARLTLRRSPPAPDGPAAGRRELLLIGIIVVYVLVTDLVTFDLRLPTDLFVLQFSSWELISIVVLTVVLKVFWQAGLGRCVAASAVWVIALASVFRYVFHILLPGSA